MNETVLRRCGRCGESKPVDDFNWRRRAKGQRDVDQARERKQMLAVERTTYLLAYFADHPCADCGEDDPVVLEFDHLGDKEFGVGSALPYRAWASILEEIAKCDVVCANCHRRRTARRAGHLRHRLTQSGRPDSNRYRDLGRV